MQAFENVCFFLDKRIRLILAMIPNHIKNAAVEIVLRKDAALYVVCTNAVYFIDDYGHCCENHRSNAHVVCMDEITQTVMKCCGYAIYAHKDELMNGFVSLGNGCRLSVCGNVGLHKGALTDLSAIDCARIRIAREKQCDTSFLFENEQPCSVLIVGPPACGKTTLLRCICKDLTNGKYGTYYRVSVIDERNEVYPQGMKRTPCLDVLSGIDKAIGINRAVRLCSPQIIICDEIGTVNEAKAILQSLHSGVAFVCSMHAKGKEEIFKRECFRLLQNSNVFDKLVLMKGMDSPGRISEIIELSEVCHA